MHLRFSRHFFQLVLLQVHIFERREKEIICGIYKGAKVRLI